MDQITWTKEDYQLFWEVLQLQKDEKYRRFQEKLLRSALPVVGIRTPFLRKAAKGIAKAQGAKFLAHCGEGTYEERLLYAFVLTELSLDYDEFIEYCDYYTEQLVENWAHCDLFCSSLKKIAGGHEEAFFLHAKGYLASQNPWVVRVGLIIFLNHYLTPKYLDEVLLTVDHVDSNFYYVEMAQAWLLATAWVRDPEKVRNFIQGCHLSISVKKKFIQKGRDSFCVSKEDKDWLGALRGDL